MKSIIAKRMVPTFDPTNVQGTWEYPGYDFREIFLVRSEYTGYPFNPDTDPYNIVAYGYFAHVKDDLLEPNTLWLPDGNGVCKITANDAPYNKRLGYVRFMDGFIDRDRLTENYYILGLNKPLKVTLDYLRRTK